MGSRGGVGSGSVREKPGQLGGAGPNGLPWRAIGPQAGEDVLVAVDVRRLQAEKVLPDVLSGHLSVTALGQYKQV